MFYLLTGNDQSKKLARLKLILEATGATREDLPPKTLPRLDQINASALFGAPSVLVLEDSVDLILKQNLTKLLSDSKRTFVELVNFLKPAEKKELEKNGAKIEDYSAPQTEPELIAWGIEFCKNHGRSIQPATVSKLILQTGLQPPFDIVNFQTELEKLISSSSKEITDSLIDDLVFDNQPIDIWALSNALAEKSGPKILESLEKYFSNSTEDEKSIAIQLSGQIAEQARNLLLVKSSLGIPDQQILKDTGWKPARLSIMKRSASKFSEASLKGLLKKMESLDIELKRTTTPPKMLLTLILTQI